MALAIFCWVLQDLHRRNHAMTYEDPQNRDQWALSRW